jgi:hypothetical protein
LRIYNAAGNVVNKIRVGDDGNRTAADIQARRMIGTWDLTDTKGRLVSEGMYLIRGVITTSDGKKERVSLLVGVQ